MEAGKRGYAKSVRRWLRTITEAEMYRNIKADLPVRWESAIKETTETA